MPPSRHFCNVPCFRRTLRRQCSVKDRFGFTLSSSYEVKKGKQGGDSPYAKNDCNGNAENRDKQRLLPLPANPGKGRGKEQGHAPGEGVHPQIAEKGHLGVRPVRSLVDVRPVIQCTHDRADNHQDRWRRREQPGSNAPSRRHPGRLFPAKDQKDAPKHQ